MRDAWLRCMQRAMEARGVTGGLRRFLDQRFAQVADFLRNAEGQAEAHQHARAGVSDWPRAPERIEHRHRRGVEGLRAGSR